MGISRYLSSKVKNTNILNSNLNNKIYRLQQLFFITPTYISRMFFISSHQLIQGIPYKE